VRFVRSPEALHCPDLLILPGTKNTAWDLSYIRKIGWENTLKSHFSKTPIMGICGGFEMLGEHIYDPHHLESNLKQIQGLGFFDFTVHFKKEKTVKQVCYQPYPHHMFKDSGPIFGYEIHQGEIHEKTLLSPLFFSKQHTNGTIQDGTIQDGTIHQDHLTFGTFVHDIFQNPLFTRTLVNHLRKRRGLPPLKTPLIDPKKERENSLDRLACDIKRHIDMESLLS